ncbi:hypothetical protein [Photobacterium iliopiscarium]|uniref:hypothetical protein n=1 Tax=Photobacterium iliopiscarium TaxID=56192 RepID=UPI001E38D751|nr:hypothetical protein [Photobacterium iliopiscarium]MCD9487211.1 hypothetical protein [Photobacterium iliopiscarium]MCF2243783.1 hypothetical protein [Photobacterium iliopiscarium]
MEIMVSINKNQSIDFELAEQIDNFVDDLLIKHRDNSEMMNLMALEATSLATSVTSRSKSLEEQGFLSRFWGDLTGKNQKITSRNTRDLAQSQYLGQQMLNKLAENNLMTYQMVVALGDKVNRVVADVNDTKLEIAQLNANLTQFFSSIRQTLEAKFDQFERNDDLLFWKETLAFEPVYKGKTYIELTRPEKMISLANEFYRHSRQQWSSRDLAFLKSIMVSIGHHPDEEVTLKEVYQAYQCEPELLNQLFKGIDAAPELHDDEVITPTLMAFGKLQSLETNDSHIVDTIVKYSPATSKQDICLDLTCNYVESTAGRNLDREVPFFDVVMNMVEDLVFYKQLQTTQAMLANQEQLLIGQQQDEVAEQQKALALIESTKIQVEKNCFTESSSFQKLCNLDISNCSLKKVIFKIVSLWGCFQIDAENRLNDESVFNFDYTGLNYIDIIPSGSSFILFDYDYDTDSINDFSLDTGVDVITYDDNSIIKNSKQNNSQYCTKLSLKIGKTRKSIFSSNAPNYISEITMIILDLDGEIEVGEYEHPMGLLFVEDII